MPEAFSSIHISGDLGQALAVDEDGVHLFQGDAVREANEQDIRIFYHFAADILEIEPERASELDHGSLQAELDRLTRQHDALRFLLHGMDRTLSDGVRFRAIRDAGRLLEDQDALTFVIERFLRPADEELWDAASAHILSALSGVHLPSLLYRTVARGADVIESAPRNPEEWRAIEAKLPELAGDGPTEEWIDGWRKALGSLGMAVLGGSRPNIALFEHFAERFRNSTLPIARFRHAQALVNQALLHARDDRPSSARTPLDRLLGQSIDDQSLPPLLRSKAHLIRAAVAFQVGDAVQAAADYRLSADWALKADAAKDDFIATAIFGEAFSQAQLGDFARAIERYNDLIARFGRTTEGRTGELVQKSAYNLGTAQAGRGRHDLAIAAYRAFQMRYAGLETPLVQAARASASYNMALSFETLENSEAAINAYVAAVELASDPNPKQEKLLAKAMFNLAVLAQREGRLGEAEAYYDRIQLNFRVNPAPDIRAIVARARLNSAVVQMAAGRYIEAKGTLEELTFGFFGTDLPGWEDLMQKVTINLNYIRQFLGVFDEEETAEAEAQVFYDDD